MPNISDQFWTDNQQAHERLAESLILYDNQVVKVREVTGAGKISFYRPEDGSYGTAMMEDNKWGKFRTLPRLGWFNVALKPGKYTSRPLVGAVYLSRRSIKSRTHGLTSAGVTVYDFFTSQNTELVKSGILSLEVVYACGTYSDPQHYTPFTDAYPLLREGVSVALSPKFALHKDKNGLVWLYRKRKIIALVPDVTSLLLLKSAQFYREDILSNRKILPLEVKDL